MNEGQALPRRFTFNRNIPGDEVSINFTRDLVLSVGENISVAFVKLVPKDLRAGVEKPFPRCISRHSTAD